MSPSGKSQSSESSSVAMKPSRLVAVKYCVFMVEAYNGRWADAHAPAIERRCVADREAAAARAVCADRAPGPPRATDQDLESRRGPCWLESAGSNPRVGGRRMNNGPIAKLLDHGVGRS